MNFHVRQSATEVKVIAILRDNNQFVINYEVVDHVINSFGESGLTQDDPIVIMSAVGQPSTGKTGLQNGLLNWLRPHSTTPMADFPVPKNFQEPRHKYDAIVVYPALAIQHDDGTRRGVLMLDVWNNSRMSEDVYIKLVEFCFKVSSLRIFSLCNPLRPIQWWNAGSAFEASSLPELRIPCWKNVTMEWPQPNLTAVSQQQSSPTPELHENYNNCGKVPHFIAIIDATSGQAGLFQVSKTGAYGNESRVTVSEKGFNFIMEKIINADSNSCKFSELKTQLMSSFSADGANSSTEIPITSMDPSSHEGNIDKGTGDPSEGSSHVTADHSDVQMMDTEQPYDTKKAQTVIDDIEGLIASLGPQIDKYLEGYFSQTAIQEFSKVWQISGSDQLMLANSQCNPDHAAINIALTLTRTLPSSLLPQDIAKFTSELTKTVKERILQRMEGLKKPMKPTCDVVTQNLNMPPTEPQSIVHPGNEPSQVQQQPTTKAISALTREKVPESAEIWHSNVEDPEFAKKASKFALDSVQERLLKYLARHGILTDADILNAFKILVDTAKTASSSVPGFNLSKTILDTPLGSLQPSVSKFLDQIRLNNSNAMRRWDRALVSALQKTNQAYNQLMDENLSNYKISQEKLDKLHDDCIQKAVEKFDAPSEISRATIEYCKQILLKSKSEEWRLGYATENETKEDAPQFSEATPLTPGPTQPPSILQSLAACSVGIFFGPDVVTFKAHIPDGAAGPFQLELKPCLAICKGKIALGDETEGIDLAAAVRYNVFDILTNFGTAPSRPSYDSENINGHSVYVTSEAAAVLFFQEAINRISAATGRRVESCAVAVPGLLPRGALTAIKTAAELAGLSKNVTLVPISISSAMALAQSSPDETFGDVKEPKKLLTIYHAGSYLEVALTHVWNGKLETQGLMGYISLPSQRSAYLLAVTESAIKKFNCRDLSAILIITGNQFDPAIETAVRSWYKGSVPMQTKFPNQIAEELTEFNAGPRSATAGREPSKKYSDFVYYYPHQMHLNGNSNVPITGRFKCVYKAGSKGFHMSEQGSGCQWVYNFELGPQACDGPGCAINLLPDGSFHVGAPENGAGAAVHCSASKLLTVWDQEIVKKNVERVIQALKVTTELGLSPKAEITSSRVKSDVQDSRDRLSQLLRSVEQVLTMPGSEDDPLCKHVSKSLAEHRELLQNPNVSVDDLNSAIEKLELQKGMLD